MRPRQENPFTGKVWEGGEPVEVALTPSQFDALMYIADARNRGQPASIRGACFQFEITPNGAYGIIQALTKKGFLKDAEAKPGRRGGSSLAPNCKIDFFANTEPGRKLTYSLELVKNRTKNEKKMKIEYRIGDATHPIGILPLIAQICNDVGKWGKGFVLAISKRWSEPERAYREGRPGLGEVQFIKVFDNGNPIVVANMVAQSGVVGKGNPNPLRLASLELCLDQVADYAILNGNEVHMPRIGTGLANGKWQQIEPLIQKCLCDRGIRAFVYDLKEKS